MKKLILGILVLSTTYTIYAQTANDTTQLENVIIEENRIQIPFNLSARNIQVITKEDIAKLPVKSVLEVLSYIGGVDLRQRGPMGTQADVSIDGGSFEQTMVLLNGVKLMDSQTAHNMLNLPVPLEAIERIEILKGPAARIYGINALSGAVNIVTKKSSETSVSVNTYAGSSFQAKETGDGNGIYGGGGLQVTANFGTEKQQHLVALSKDIYNGQRYNSAQNNNRVFYDGRYILNQNHQINWMGSYIHNDFGANGYYAAPGDRESREVVETAIFSVSSKHQWKNFTLSPRISNRYNEDDYRYFRHNLKKARSQHYSNALMAELNANLKTSIGLFGFGLESRFEQLNSSNMGKHQRDNHGIYAEYKNIFWKKLITTVGAYGNFNTKFGWQVYPGLDVAYLVSPSWKFGLNIGSGQRIPSFTDLYLNQKPGNVGNPNLQPENSWQYEAHVQYRYKNFKIKAGYFYRDVNQFIDWIRDSITVPYSPANMGRNQIQGINIHTSQFFHLKHEQKISYSLSYNYLQPTLQSKNYFSKYILESLKHQFIFGLNYQTKGFTASIQTRIIERELLKAYCLLDFRMTYQWKSYLVYADISNILNTEYKEIGAVPMPPRWFSAGFKYRFIKPK